VSRQKALNFQTRDIAYSGELPNQTAYLSPKDFHEMVSTGVGPREVVILAAVSATWVGGGSLRLKASLIGRRPYLFSIMPDIRLTTEENHGKPQSEQPSSHRTAPCADLAVF
jgi:hypothetical protein